MTGRKWIRMGVWTGLPVVLLLFTLITIPSAQAAENDLQSWSPVIIQIPVTRKAHLSTQVEPRLSDNLENINQLIIRPGVYYDLNKHMTAGVTVDYNHSYQPKFREEVRIGQELHLRHKLLELPVTHRFRLDERMIDGLDTVVRARMRNQMVYPIKDTRWFLIASNELLVNLNTAQGGPQGGFDQNRLYAGIGRKIGRYTMMEGGYQFTYINRANPTPDLMAHVLFLRLTLNFRN